VAVQGRRSCRWGGTLAAWSAIASIVAVLALALGATTASAVIAELGDGTTVSYLPMPGSASASVGARRFDAFFKNLDYNGGPVMPANTNYTVYWSPSGASAYPAGFTTGVNKYFEDLAHDSGGSLNVDSVATQYNDATGTFAQYNSKFGGERIDTHAYPKSGNCTRAPICLTDAQIKTELARYVSENGLPTGLGVEYLVLPPSGVESCFEAAGFACSANVAEPLFRKFCAYHSAVPLEGGGQIIYSNDPFVNGKLCDEPHHINGSSDSALLGGLSHEHIESLTDPEPNSAWTDFGGSGGLTGYEIGDKCRTGEPLSEFGPALGKVKVGLEELTYNQEINGDRYWYQQEWSNKEHKCLQRLSFSSSEAPNAAFTNTPLGGTTVKFDATGSTTGAGVRYSWQFSDIEGVEPKTIETTGLTLIHEFPFSGVYNVALTVYKADGTSVGTAREVIAGKVGQAIGFLSHPPAPATVGGPAYTVAAKASSGLPVSFTVAPFSSSVCSISGSTVSFTGPGLCTIDANQSGSLEFEPAPQVAQAIGVIAPPSAAAPTAGAPPAAVSVPPPTSSFTGTGTVDQVTGTITLTTTVGNPGTFSWLLTFQNGKFGVFAASSHRCKAGFVRLGGKCRPARVVFARGSQGVAAAGKLTFKLRPSASALKALKNALKQKKGLIVTATFTFQSARGGSPVTHTQTMTVKLKKR
jgi:hypothetical protein